MEEVVIAVGSNLGDRLDYIQKAGRFLESLSGSNILKSSIWESEPVGGAKYSFLNSTAKIESEIPPKKLLKKLKSFETECGREENPERWSPRVIDMDIIRYGNLVIQAEGLIIPHPEFGNRLFVLLPMLEIDEGWQDPQSKKTLNELAEAAPKINIQKTEYSW